MELHSPNDGLLHFVSRSLSQPAMRSVVYVALIKRLKTVVTALSANRCCPGRILPIIGSAQKGYLFSDFRNLKGQRLVEVYEQTYLVAVCGNALWSAVTLGCSAVT